MAIGVAFIVLGVALVLAGLSFGARGIAPYMIALSPTVVGSALVAVAIVKLLPDPRNEKIDKRMVTREERARAAIQIGIGIGLVVLGMAAAWGLYDPETNFYALALIWSPLVGGAVLMT